MFFPLIFFFLLSVGTYFSSFRASSRTHAESGTLASPTTRLKVPASSLAVGWPNSGQQRNCVAMMALELVIAFNVVVTFSKFYSVFFS